MSQFYQGTTAGALPPSVVLQITADENGTVVAAANNINLYGGFTSDNDEDGIRVYGDAGGDTGTIQLTNRLYGGTSTIDDSTADAITFTLPADNAVYIFEYKVAAKNVTDGTGAAFSLFAAVRSDGATATKIGVTDKIKNAEGAMVDANADVAVLGNDVILQVTGLAGKNITWTGLGSYLQSV